MTTDNGRKIIGAIKRVVLVVALLFPLYSADAFSCFHNNQLRQLSSSLSMVKIWIEEAPEDFVDHEENLEDGEVCLRAVQAFASNPDDPLEPRFLCAGALVQRPLPPPPPPSEAEATTTEADNNNSEDKAIMPPQQFYDAWIGDSILDGLGGPNLQKLGALQVIDALFLDHLERQHESGLLDENPNLALRSFVVQCSSSSDYTCASFQAIQERGFQPIWDEEEDDDDDGYVFNYQKGKKLYDEVAARRDHDNAEASSSSLAFQIAKILPMEDSMNIQQYTTARTSSPVDDDNGDNQASA